ncbi:MULTISPECIES: Sec-independent protein translocase protein TatB [Alphaproteobacteria]|uniref:Sec-independent protein translocase protein TatB n=2 Tax=Alphaproteobacteria TaxID=28211 RepID=A0A512HHG0_9HYPH|nr:MULTISPECIES: Sec-independent protein translocase protein TatB [Alphaproteobacteria]GEO84883.1 sec-independent protein translocase protein TatB [Ciceribacter naphthalenivorans]GLR22817.1 sec-independent protein translocase protein TatB [Ciceribacter naphthalenivorans]GLT05673.1 sec-independent protein translocase protein TatB [Sphingomonas psychrolutea]
MLDIGWTELLVIAVILIVVVGPKDLPPMIRAFGKMTSRLRRTAGEFRAQFDEALREAELDDLRKSVEDVRGLNPKSALRDVINPLRQMGNEIKSDLKKATTADAKAAAGITSPESEATPPASFPEMPSPLAGLPDELAHPMPDPAPTAAPTIEPTKTVTPRKAKAKAPGDAVQSVKKAAGEKPAKASRAKPASTDAGEKKPAAPKKPRKPKSEEPA